MSPLRLPFLHCNLQTTGFGNSIASLLIHSALRSDDHREAGDLEAAGPRPVRLQGRAASQGLQEDVGEVQPGARARSLKQNSVQTGTGKVRDVLARLRKMEKIVPATKRPSLSRAGTTSSGTSFKIKLYSIKQNFYFKNIFV
jgi:hypothetical protein